MKSNIFLFIVLAVLIIFNFKAVSAENTAGNNDRTALSAIDKGTKTKFTNLELTRAFFWSSYASNGTLSFIHSLGQLGYAYSTAQDIAVLSKRLNRYNIISVFDNLSTTFPGIILGYNLIMAGTSFIPAAGGIVYGSLNYITALTLLIVYSFYSTGTLELKLDTGSIPAGSDRTKTVEDVDKIIKNIFNPLAYFIIGTFALLFGSAEIVAYMYYQKEIKLNKYPYMQKVFSFGPGFVSIKFGS